MGSEMRFGAAAADWAGWGTVGAPSLYCFSGTTGVDRHLLSTVCEVVPADRYEARNHTDWSWFVEGRPVRLLTRVVGRRVDDDIPYTAIAMMLNP